jgi:hypothetical protein
VKKLSAKKVQHFIESILNEADPDVTITYEPRVREISLKFFDTSNWRIVKNKIKTMTVDDYTDLAHKFSLPHSLVSGCLNRYTMMSSFTLFSKSRQEADKINDLFHNLGCLVVYTQPA